MAYFDRFDICEAHYVFASLYHGGARSPEYRIFGRLSDMQFRPAPALGRDSLTENGRDIMAGLVRRWRQCHRKGVKRGTEVS